MKTQNSSFQLEITEFIGNMFLNTLNINNATKTTIHVNYIFSFSYILATFPFFNTKLQIF